MPEHYLGEIKYHTFATFDRLNIDHAVITRHGGISPTPWDTLNLATTVGDEKTRVRENINRIYEAFSIEKDHVFDVWQVHSDRVINTKIPRKINAPHQKGDGIITDQPGLALMMRFADCLPILLYDTRKKVIGIAHAGWKGTVLKIAAKTIQAMHDIYRSDPVDIVAGIGPSIAAHHYEIGEDVAQEVRNMPDVDKADILINKDNSTYLDLWRANQIILEQAGIIQIEIAGICTACNTQDWFSHRGEKGRSGRFGVYIRL